ncbi:MAG: DUF4358 domain-containing protein [Lachnospiraceae bacterium]|nr:DUF4358 domain-containing protein [Ruminococcus sp.]MCM1276379.1 DUF4358 domain-containing protein [Lachnospiraceae bacterium]
MKKYIAILAAAALALSLTACSTDGGKTSNTDSKQSSLSGNDSKTSDSAVTKTPEPKEAEAAIAKALGDGYYCTVDVPDDEVNLSCLGRLDLTKVESYIVKQTTVPSVQLDCVAVVKCKSGYADEAVNALNEYYAQTIGYIRQYPFDVAKVEGARIFKSGDVVMYIVAGASADESASEEEAAKLAAEYKKVDAAVKELFGTLPENLAVIPEDSGDNGGLLIGG